MSDAKQIADTRLARGEITSEEHSKIVAAVDAGSSPSLRKGGHEAIPDPPKIMWGLALAGTSTCALVIKEVTDDLVQQGDSVNWTIVYIIYAVCALIFIVGLVELTDKKS